MEHNENQSRRDFLRAWIRNAVLAGLAVFGGSMFRRQRVACGSARSLEECTSCPELTGCKLPEALSARKAMSEHTVWQLDPEKCVQCGQCATHCVLSQSAVKCVHAFSMCGYCKLCFGYFEPGVKKLHEGAENQMCPSGAIIRKFIEPPYFEYTIDKTLCIGCAKCVKGCGSFGNGSLFLQVDHSVCLDCNDCSIARHCPADAYKRVSADRPYIKKGEETG